MGLKNFKKILISTSVILIVIVFGYFYRYSEYYINKIYDYKIEEAKKVGNYIKAEEFYKKKVTFTDDYFSKEIALNNLILFYIDQKLYESALEVYLKEKMQMPAYLISPVYGCKNFTEELNLIDIYCEIAFLYLQIDDNKKAEEYANKAIGILKNLDKGCDSSVGKKIVHNYKIFAYIEIKKNNLSSAKKYLDKIKEILISYNVVKKEGQSAYSDYYEVLYYYYINKKEYNEAKLCIEKLFSLSSATYLPLDFVSELNSQVNYLIHFNKDMGEIYCKQKEYIDAQRHYEISYNLSNELNGKYHPDTICSKYRLIEVFEKQNKQEIAKRYADEIKNETKGFRLLKNMNDNNFEEKLNSFCS